MKSSVFLPPLDEPYLSNVTVLWSSLQQGEKLNHWGSAKKSVKLLFNHFLVISLC